MTIDSGALQHNLDLSFNRVIKDRFEVMTSTPFGGTYANRVFYDDPLGDPTALDQRRTALRYWVGTNVLMGGVGLKVPTIMQLDFYSAIGDSSNQSTSDRWGHKLQSMIVDFIGIWTPSDGSFPIYDWSNLASPVLPTPPLLPMVFLIRNSRGQFGWPDENVPLEPDRGLNHRVVSYHCWHQNDLVGTTGGGGNPIYF